MIPLYEIFIEQSLRFQIRVLAWVLPDNHVFLPNLILI